LSVGPCRPNIVLAESQEQAMADDRERKAAEAKFKKSERATEDAQAMSEYNAERQAERAKTARLRELRLAKEAADKKKGSDPAPADRELGDSRATKAGKQKKARQQSDQRMKHQDPQRSGDSKVTRDNPAARMALSPDDPMAKARKNTARVKK
jgi:hypothetical protein